MTTGGDLRTTAESRWYHNTFQLHDVDVVLSVGGKCGIRVCFTHTSPLA